MRHRHGSRHSTLAGLFAALVLLAFPVAAQAGSLSASPPSSDFNTQPYFFGSQFNNFQVTNSGTDTTLGAATITGPDAARFSVNGDGCDGQTLQDTNFCFVGVNFNPPNGPGTFNAQLEIPSDGTPNTLVISLSAQALAGASFSSSPPRVDFGATVVGEERRQQLTITNDGDFSGGIQQAFIVGPEEFTIADDQCSQQPLNPGESCSLTVAFRPQLAREYQGAVFNITGGGAQPVLPINLSGEGRLTPGPAPDTSITQSPPKKAKSRIASFQFTSPEAGVSFECKLDAGPFAPCSSPSTYSVKRGQHTFAVRAKDAEGNVDATPATQTWRVKKAKKK